MIDDVIISKALLHLVVRLSAVMDAPWGPHFGLSLTFNAKPNDVSIRVLVQPTLPSNVVAMIDPKFKGKKAEIKDNISRHEARDAEVAKEILVQSDSAELWCGSFVAASWHDTKLDTDDPA